MSVRLIEVIAAAGNTDTILAAAEKHAVIDTWRVADAGDGRVAVRLLVPLPHVQALTDALQRTLSHDKSYRIVLLTPVATLPEVEEVKDDKGEHENAVAASREELYDRVAQGARIDSTFLLLVALSTLVAGIGLIGNNLAVIIGAMVIAPLLGPNLAFSFAVALGDRPMMRHAIVANLAGLSLAVGVAIIGGVFVPLDLSSHEFMSRTVVSYDGIVLALATGAAAALSLVSGLSSALVGVMVAVALLPPAATLGLALGAGAWHLAAGAATLLGANLVCVNLAAQIVLVSRGIRPRTWWRRKEAQQSVILSVVFWFALLVMLLAIIYAEHIG